MKQETIRLTTKQVFNAIRSQFFERLVFEEVKFTLNHEEDRCSEFCKTLHEFTGTAWNAKPRQVRRNGILQMKEMCDPYTTIADVVTVHAWASEGYHTAIWEVKSSSSDLNKELKIGTGKKQMAALFNANSFNYVLAPQVADKFDLDKIPKWCGIWRASTNIISPDLEQLRRPTHIPRTLLLPEMNWPKFIEFVRRSTRLDKTDSEFSYTAYLTAERRAKYWHKRCEKAEAELQQLKKEDQNEQN